MVRLRYAALVTCSVAYGLDRAAWNGIWKNNWFVMAKTTWRLLVLHPVVVVMVVIIMKND